MRRLSAAASLHHGGPALLEAIFVGLLDCAVEPGRAADQKPLETASLVLIGHQNQVPARHALDPACRSFMLKHKPTRTRSRVLWRAKGVR